MRKTQSVGKDGRSLVGILQGNEEGVSPTKAKSVTPFWQGRMSQVKRKVGDDDNNYHPTEAPGVQC